MHAPPPTISHPTSAGDTMRIQNSILFLPSSQGESPVLRTDNNLLDGLVGPKTL